MADLQKRAVLDEVISVAGDSTPNAPNTSAEADPERWRTLIRTCRKIK